MPVIHRVREDITRRRRESYPSIGDGSQVGVLSTVIAATVDVSLNFDQGVWN